MLLEDLNAFVAVAQFGSFSKASAGLCVAQSALSKRVHRLEGRIGTPLLVRGPRGVMLTDAGHAFLAKTQRLVEDMAALERNLSPSIVTPAGEVSIALPQRTAGLLAPPVIERCLAELPLVNLHILEGSPSNVHGWLMRGEADVGMTYNPELGSGFSVVPILSEPLFFFSSPTAIERHFGGSAPEKCTIADLARQPLILPRKPNIVRVLADRLCAGHGVRPNVFFEADGFATIRGMVERGMGSTIFSLSTTWSYAVEAGRLLAIPFDNALMQWKLYLACSQQSLDAVAIDRVRTIVDQEIRSLLDRGAWPNARQSHSE